MLKVFEYRLVLGLIRAKRFVPVDHGQFTVRYLPDLTDGNHTMAEAVSYRGFSNNREICINKCMFDRNGSVQDFS